MVSSYYCTSARGNGTYVTAFLPGHHFVVVIEYWLAGLADEWNESNDLQQQEERRDIIKKGDILLCSSECEVYDALSYKTLSSFENFKGAPEMARAQSITLFDASTTGYHGIYYGVPCTVVCCTSTVHQVCQ